MKQIKRKCKKCGSIYLTKNKGRYMCIDCGRIEGQEQLPITRSEALNRYDYNL